MITPNKFAKNVEIHPTKKYSEQNRAWQGAPSIERTPAGRLYVAFMSGGIYEPDPRNCCLVIYSDDNGDSWSEPLFSIESKHDEHIRAFEPQFWLDPDNKLWMFWAETPYLPELSLPTYEQKIDMENDSEYHLLEDKVRTYASVCENPDSDTPVWSEPRYMFNAVIRNKPLVCKNGRWIFPTYLTGPRDYYEIYYTDDKCESFKTSRCYGRTLNRAYDEPSLHYTTDGRIAMVVRTTPPVYKIMLSSDDGESWTSPEPFTDAASERPCTKNLKCGGTIMILSIDKKVRTGLRLTYSEDGYSFKNLFPIDDRERISYPDVAEDENGTLYVAYDRERNNKIRKSRVTGYSEAAKEILFARIPRSAIESGTPNEDTVRARVITKARINALDNQYTK